MTRACDLDPNDLVVKLLDARGRVRLFEAIERDVLAAALHHHGGHPAPAARALGIGRSTLYRKMKTYDLS